MAKKFGKSLQIAFLTAVVGTMGGLAVVETYGLSDQEGARQIVEQSNYTDIQYKGHKVFGCGKGDWYRDEFKAKAANGQEVDLLVCQGLPVVGKGGTVRILR